MRPHDGVDLYLRLDVDGVPLCCADLAGQLRGQLQDPAWQPYFDSERFAWVGGYHALSVRPEDTLDTETLERRGRRRKRLFLEGQLGRVLAQRWHEAPTPEAVGLEFVAGLRLRSEGRNDQLDLFCRLPHPEAEEAWVAAQLNTRLRLPGDRRFLESEGWSYRNELQQLVFRIPAELGAETPRVLEVWWATDERKRVTEVPCYEEGAAPPELLRGRWTPSTRG